MGEKYWRRKDLEQLRHNRRLILALYDTLAESREQNRMLILCHKAELENIKDKEAT